MARIKIQFHRSRNSRPSGVYGRYTVADGRGGRHRRRFAGFDVVWGRSGLTLILAR